jgi:hypothetical protein
MKQTTPAANKERRSGFIVRRSSAEYLTDTSINRHKNFWVSKPLFIGFPPFSTVPREDVGGADLLG